MGVDNRAAAVFRAMIFWIALSCVLLSSLALGANRPVSWTLLWAVSATLYTLLIVVDFLARDAALAWRRALPAITLWVLVLVWAIIQSGPAPVAEWAHPAWTDADGVGALDNTSRRAWPWDLASNGIKAMSISADPVGSLDGVMRLSTYLMLFWIGARGATDRTARAAVRTIAVFSIVLALFGMVALFTDYNPITGMTAYRDSVTASFINKNAYALYAAFGAMSCLAALALRMPVGRPGERDVRRTLRDLLEALFRGGWIWLSGFVVLLAAMLYTISRGGVIAGLIGIGLLLSLTLGRGNAVWRWGFLLLLSLPAVAISLGAGGLFDRLMLRDPASDGRIALFEHVITGIQNRPLLGHGLGSFQDAFRAYTSYDLAIAEWDLAHNAYLENAFELGIPATAALILAILMIAVRLALGVRTRRSQRPIPALALSILVAGGLHSTVDFSMQMPATAALAAFIVGLGWSQSRRSMKSKHNLTRESAKNRSAVKSALKTRAVALGIHQ